MRVVQGTLRLARDDMENFTKSNIAAAQVQHNRLDRAQVERTPGVLSPSAEAQTADEQSEESTPVARAAAAVAETASEVLATAKRALEIVCSLACVAVAATLREATKLFEQKAGGAPPSAPRVAVLMVLVVTIWTRRRRHGPLRQAPRGPSQAPWPVSAAVAPLSPSRHLPTAAARGLSLAPGAAASAAAGPVTATAGIVDLNRGRLPLLPNTTAVTAAGLSSPSRALLSGSLPLTSPAAVSRLRGAQGEGRGQAEGQGQRQRQGRWQLRQHGGGISDGIDPSLPSPAEQARDALPQARRGLSRRGQDSRRVDAVGGFGGGDSTDEPATSAAASTAGTGAEAEARGRGEADWFWRRWKWGLRLPWGRLTGGLTLSERSGTCGQRRWVWLLFLWIVASVLEVRRSRAI